MSPSRLQHNNKNQQRAKVVTEQEEGQETCLCGCCYVVRAGVPRLFVSRYDCCEVQVMTS